MYGNKIKNAQERKQIKDQEQVKYQTQLVKVKKMRDMNSQDPIHLSKLKVEEEAARSQLLHLESTSNQLATDIDEIIKRKH